MPGAGETEERQTGVASVIPISGFADPFSSLSHLFGAAVFGVLSIPMLVRARGDSQRLASVAIFCAGAISLLAVSGLYHLLDPQGAARAVLQRLDHAFIFVLIAASFTPIHVILFQGWGKWGILILVWCYAVVAIVLKMVFFNNLPPLWGLALYLMMGWIGLVPGLALWRRYGFQFIKPMLFGGIAYTLGGALEALQWPVIVSGVIQWHECFHVAVLVGLAFHWGFIYDIADGHMSPSVGEQGNAPGQ